MLPVELFGLLPILTGDNPLFVHGKGIWDCGGREKHFWISVFFLLFLGTSKVVIIFYQCTFHHSTVHCNLAINQLFGIWGEGRMDPLRILRPNLYTVLKILSRNFSKLYMCSIYSVASGVSTKESLLPFFSTFSSASKVLSVLMLYIHLFRSNSKFNFKMYDSSSKYKTSLMCHH